MLNWLHYLCKYVCYDVFPLLDQIKSLMQTILLEMDFSEIRLHTLSK